MNCSKFESLKILLLTHRIPYPLRDGGAIAMHQSIQGYLDLGYSVSLLAMNTARHWVETNDLPPIYSQLHRFETVYVNNAINPIAAFFNLFSDKSYHVDRFINKAFNQALSQLLQEESFDLIQFESLYTSPYLSTARRYSQAPCLCRVHNIEHHIWQHLADNEPNFVKRKYLRLLTQRLKNYELTVLKSFDLLLPISPAEQEYINQEQLGTCYYVPFGINIHETIPVHTVDALSCYHIGSMDWAPNVEGIEWFLQHVWLKSADEFPEAAFYIAGKNMPPSLRKHESKRVHIVGEVDDFIGFSLEKNILIVPLRSGGGIRIKILEAMALGKTIIATAKGAEGIPCEQGQHILLANTANEFMESLRFCFQQPEQARAIGERAREWVAHHFNQQHIFAELNIRLHQLTDSRE